ncbi:MAG TPA: hypothetical protein VF104_11555, partial [Burkholderiales bacterium]
STLLLRVMDRFPVIVTIGAGLLGWVAGEMAVTDPLIKEWIDTNAAWMHGVVPAAGAAFVIGAGKWLAARSETASEAAPVVDLAAEDPPGRPPGQNA